MAKAINNAMIMLDSYDIIDASKFNDMPISSAIQELANEYADEIQNMSLTHIEYVANYNMKNKVANAVQITLLNEMDDDKEVRRTTGVLYSQADVILPLLWYDVIKWMISNINNDESDDPNNAINMIVENMEYLLSNNDCIKKIITAQYVIDHMNEIIDPEEDDPKHWN